MDLTVSSFLLFVDPYHKMIYKVPITDTLLPLDSEINSDSVPLSSNLAENDDETKITSTEIHAVRITTLPSLPVAADVVTKEDGEGGYVMYWIDQGLFSIMQSTLPKSPTENATDVALLFYGSSK